MPKAVSISQVPGKPGQVYYPLRIDEVSRPDPKPNELVIKLHAAAINHRDLFIRQHLYPAIAFGTPLLADGCGRVVAIGSAANPSWLNKRVVLNPGTGWNDSPDGPEAQGGYRLMGGTRSNGVGTLQEYCVIDQGEVEEAPPHLSDVECAAIPLAGLTAWRAVMVKCGARNLGPGKNVLITGIGGGVALMALMFVAGTGANAWVTSGNRAKIDKAVDLGAKGGVSYKDKEWVKKLLDLLPEANQRFDAIVDGAGGNIIEMAPKLLKDGGIVSVYGMTTGPKMPFVMQAVLKNIEVKGSTAGNRKEFRDMMQFVHEKRARPVSITYSILWTTMSKSGKPQKRLAITHGPHLPELQHLTWGELLRRHCRRRSSDIALISAHENQVLTYSELNRRSDILAAAFLDAGIQKGDRVAILLDNRSVYVDIFFACAKTGAIITLLNFAYTPTELRHALTLTKAKLLITATRTARYDYTKVLKNLERDLESLETLVHLSDVPAVDISASFSSKSCSYTEFLRRGSKCAVSTEAAVAGTSDSDILNIQFTSGSTGMPKAAALTHSGLLNSAIYIGRNLGITNRDRIIIPVPLFHAFGLCTCFAAGAAAVLPSAYFDAGMALSAVEKYHGTGLYGVTTMWIDMLSHPKFASTKRQSLRFGLISGSALPEGLLVRVGTKFPIPHLNTNWGMTELSSIVTMTTASDPMEKKMRTAGRLLPNFSAKIVEPDTGKCLPWGQRGEIVISGYGLMHSYFGDKDKTAQVLKQHPEDLLPGQAGRDTTGQLRVWMHTGDEGYFDPDGYFVITGRIKDLVIRGGENISPVEVEERLYMHPAIKQAAVFGIPSQRYGEEVAALLELEEGCDRPSDEEIRSWVRQTLARFKAPVKIWWLGDKARGIPAQWPKTSNGKLKKKDIKTLGAQLMKSEKQPLRASL
ncbi:uncharacterized protein PV07_04945 [Cladophialophora immunda]|uniref:Enoyl reductase (ER) domain-containing protein n=1 Tax=Cladophialophora immunda TaxID=569365 RepID=A0A0D2CD99_9EURO|nr:uncharacterized protein PV07_04945 [Cladophialophora immunda]KIW29108.1 hypothetical protein PV07_04945 [Cladophialophora immunda]